MYSWIEIPLLVQMLIIAMFIDIVINIVLLIPIYKNRKEQKNDLSIHQEPISIIVAARNESDNLLRLIPLLFKLDYSIFEVVVVDDCSYDDTHDVLLALSARYPNLKTVKVVESKNFIGGKKIALSLGIKAAKYEHLVFIDADCKPVTEHWFKRL